MALQPGATVRFVFVACLLLVGGMAAAQNDGATPLHWAVYRGDLQAVDRLIAGGANVRTANREGVTPLAMACQYGNLPIVERLLKAVEAR